MRRYTDCNGIEWSSSYVCQTEGYPLGHVEVRCGQKVARWTGTEVIIAPEQVLADMAAEWEAGLRCLDVA